MVTHNEQYRAVTDVRDVFASKRPFSTYTEIKRSNNVYATTYLVPGTDLCICRGAEHHLFIRHTTQQPIQLGPS